jgi:hypothetical protein
MTENFRACSIVYRVSLKKNFPGSLEGPGNFFYQVKL